MAAAPTKPLHEEPAFPVWSAGPDAEPRRVIFLIDAASGLERELLMGWIARQRPAEGGPAIETLDIPCSRRRRGAIDARLESALAAGDDPLLAPVRIAWLARKHEGVRSARLSDLLRLGDPRDPNRIRERIILAREPDRCRIVAGEPAPASELRERWQRNVMADVGNTAGLASFVARQAALALDRAERQLRGARYKVPRFVREDILARPAFRGELARLSRGLGRSEESVEREAAADLREIAAGHSPFVIDLVMQLWRLMYKRSYGDVQNYDRDEIERIRVLCQQQAVVFLPTHKSNLDHAVLQAVLHENGLPPNHTAGGINMNFFPLGPLVRRAGVFFIRRSFKDDEVYKLVLRHYVDFLIEKRFPLEWYIEGGRSRSGKLLPPRFGLLAYVVDAYRRGRGDDVALVPVSISYDQISDVGDYAAEQRGGQKQTEGFAWFVGILRRLGRPYGAVTLRFGEPVSLAKALGPPDPEADPDPDEQNLALQKLAFEVCVRINRVTPISPISLVCLAMLGRGDRALSKAETVDALRNLVASVDQRGLPTSVELDLDTEEGVARTLDELVGTHLLTRYDEGPEPVYGIAPQQHLAAAYYRNAVIHYFVNGAIAELALLRAAEDDVEDRLREFWDEAYRLRDLLKFEFFFADKDGFRAELLREMALVDSGWEQRLEGDGDEVRALFTDIRPYHAHRILRPFLEAYRVVADGLAACPADEPVDQPALMRACLARGRQYVLQRHVKSQESVSNVLFATAIKLARNRGLWDPGTPDLALSRRAFADEVGEVIRRVDGVESFVRARRAGVLP